MSNEKWGWGDIERSYNPERRMLPIDKQVEKHKKVFQVFRTVTPSLDFQIVQEEYPSSNDREQFADIQTTMTSGQKVEWQLGAWIDEGQVRVARQAEKLEKDLLTVLSAASIHSPHFGVALALPRNDIHKVQASDRAKLPSEFLAYFKEAEEVWVANPQLCSPQGILMPLLSYPTLLKYFVMVNFLPHHTDCFSTDDRLVIVSEGRGGAYDPTIALESLWAIICKKAKRYGPMNKTDARLLIHYDEAV